MTRSQQRGESGQATLEFALVLPLLLMLVTAVVQVGFVLHNSIDLTDAVRSGGRVASISRSLANPSAAAETALRNAAAGLDQTKLSVTVAPSSGWAPGSDVTVSASYPYTISIFGIPVRTGSLTSSTTQRVE